MTLAYWCVLVVMLLPYATSVYAKVSGGFKGKDNHEPRAFLSQLQGKAGRAQAAQANAYEINPFFAAAVIIAHVSGNVAQTPLNVLALVFVLSRLAYIVCYVNDWPNSRFLCWLVGLIAIIVLFISAAV